MLITVDQIHDHKASEVVTIICSGCGRELERKVGSIRVAIARNGIFKCRGCLKTADIKLRINAKCADCHKTSKISADSHKSNLGKNGVYLCHSCACKRAGAAGKLGGDFDTRSQASKKKWADDNFRSKVVAASAAVVQSDELRQQASERTKELWQDDQYRAKISSTIKTKFEEDPEYRTRVSDGLKRKYESDPTYKELITSIIRTRWEDPDFVELFKLRCSNQEYRERLSQALKKTFADPELRSQMSDTAKELWQDQDYRQLVINGLKK